MVILYLFHYIRIFMIVKASPRCMPKASFSHTVSGSLITETEMRVVGLKWLRYWGETLCLFVIGGGAYILLEILWRGYTHWSMFITGGLCVVLVCEMDRRLRRDTHFLARCVYGAVIITSVEFVVGCIVNLWLRWNVWDYSALPLNLMGQISLPFTMAWMLLSIPVMGMGSMVRRVWGETE